MLLIECKKGANLSDTVEMWKHLQTKCQELNLSLQVKKEGNDMCPTKTCKSAAEEEEEEEALKDVLNRSIKMDYNL